MKLAHEILTRPIVFDNQKIQVLVIENKSYYYRFLVELMGQVKGDLGRFILSKDNTPVEISKNLALVTDPLTMDINSRKLINILNTLLEKEAMSDRFFIDSNALVSEISKFGDLLLTSLPFPVARNEDYNIKALIKSLEFTYTLESNDLRESLLDYIEIHSKLGLVNCFVLANTKTYISEHEIEGLYRDILLLKANVLFVESSIGVPNANESVRVIDDDLCEIW